MPRVFPTPVLDRRVTVRAAAPVIGSRVTPWGWDTYFHALEFNERLGNGDWSSSPPPSTTQEALTGAGLETAQRFILGEYDRPAGDLGDTFVVLGPTSGQYLTFDVTAHRRVSTLNWLVVDVSNPVRTGATFDLTDQTLLAGFGAITTPVFGPSAEKPAWARRQEFESAAGLIDLTTSAQRTVDQRADFTIRNDPAFGTVVAVVDDRSREWEAFSTRAIIHDRFLIVSCKREVQVNG